MGINSLELDILTRLKKEGYLVKNGLIIEIGAQQIANGLLGAHQQLDEIAKLFDAPLPHPFPAPISSNIAHGALEHLREDAIHAREFWEWLGFTYASIDIDESPGSIALDLNFDSVPTENKGKFNLITNLGTTEHVANQLNAFKVIHDLTAVGGIMLHNLPAQGMMNHGLVNYNPKFFWMLSRSNGYKWLYADYTSDAYYYDLPQNVIDNVIPFKPNITDRSKNYKIADCGIVVALQKIYDSPYVPPLDVPSNIKTNNKILANRYWSVFKENAFNEYHKNLPATTQLQMFFHKVLRRLLPALKYQKKS